MSASTTDVVDRPMSCGPSPDGDLQLQYPPSESFATPPPDSPLEATPRPDLKLVTYYSESLSDSQQVCSPSNTESTSPSSSTCDLLTPSTDSTSPIFPPSNSFHISLLPPHQNAPSPQHVNPLPFPITSNQSASSSTHSPSGTPVDLQFPNNALPTGRVKTVGPLDTGIGTKVKITHPYARLYAKNSQEASGAGKRRKMWNHALEKSVFTPHELSTMGAPHRRTIYTASLEAHIDRLHHQLLEHALYPVPFERLEPYRGLNSKTAKSMVAGLQKDKSDLKLKLLELERSNHALQNCLTTYGAQPSQGTIEASPMRRHSIDSGSRASVYPNLFITTP